MRISTRGSKVALLKFDEVKFSKTLKKRLEVAHNQAVRTWLRAVLEEIPTYTGAARGTFKPLGRVLRVAVNRTKVLGNKKRARQKKWAYVGGRKYRVGFEYGENYGDYSIYWKDARYKLIYGFTFTSDLPYVLWNDAYPAPIGFTLPSNPPWNAFRKGAREFVRYVRTEIPKRLPKTAVLNKIQIIRVR